MHTIRYRRDIDLLDITWSGLFTTAEMERYAEDCCACLKQETFRDGYKLRIDLSDIQALPQETLSTLANAFVDFPRPSKTAMVTRSAIARLQIKRAMTNSNRIFETPEAALAWLTSS
jgi:hypothetical protein